MPLSLDSLFLIFPAPPSIVLWSPVLTEILHTYAWDLEKLSLYWWALFWAWHAITLTGSLIPCNSFSLSLHPSLAVSLMGLQNHGSQLHTHFALMSQWYFMQGSLLTPQAILQFSYLNPHTEMPGLIFDDGAYNSLRLRRVCLSIEQLRFSISCAGKSPHHLQEEHWNQRGVPLLVTVWDNPNKWLDPGWAPRLWEMSQ